MIEDVAATGDLDQFLNAASGRLTSEPAMRRAHSQPAPLDRDAILAMVRAEIAEPAILFAFDGACQLTTAEFRELLARSMAWRERLSGSDWISTPVDEVADLRDLRRLLGSVARSG